MLFHIKKNAALSLTAAVALAFISVALKHILVLDWNFHIDPSTVSQFLICLVILFVADSVIALLLITLFHTAFVRLWMDMAGYFAAQRPHTVLAGGLLAAGEEMFFRGVLLQYLIQTLYLNAYRSVAISAAAFALCHIMLNKRLALFSFWAFWEGAALGAVYIYSGSLIVTMAVHAAHDMAGFTLFSLQRRRGFLLLNKRGGY